MDIHIRELRKSFSGTIALRDIDLDIPSGQLLALLGPSGSGKTTLLRVIAGLIEPDAGRVLFGERDTTRMSLRDRRVGLVFQHYALFPHLSVFENIAFGLRCMPRKRRPAKADIARRVDELLGLMQIPELRERLPAHLSGGQKQRVALARAMAIEPSVLLLDEPFGALDAKVRVELRRWLRRIHDETGYTTIFVTHDQEEALELADRVVVMRAGAVEQDAEPGRVYGEPATPFVFDFLGRSNQLGGRVEAGVFRIDGGSWSIAAGACPAGPATLFVRPHDLRLVEPGQGFAATVGAVRSLAGRTTLELNLAGQRRSVELDLPGVLQDAPAPGTSVSLRPDRYRVFAGPDAE